MALLTKCGWQGDGAALWGELAAYVAGAHSVPLGEEAPQSWVRAGRALGRG